MDFHYFYSTVIYSEIVLFFFCISVLVFPETFCPKTVLYREKSYRRESDVLGLNID